MTSRLIDAVIRLAQEAGEDPASWADLDVTLDQYGWDLDQLDQLGIALAAEDASPERAMKLGILVADAVHRHQERIIVETVVEDVARSMTQRPLRRRGRRRPR